MYNKFGIKPLDCHLYGLGFVNPAKSPSLQTSCVCVNQSINNEDTKYIYIKIYIWQINATIFYVKLFILCKSCY